MIGSKWYITDEFSRYASEYDKFAFIQKRAAQKLADYITEHVEDKSAHSFLEIGCGTGLFTHELMQQFPKSTFHLTDISDEMVSICFKKLNSFSHGQLQFEVVDAESISPDFYSNADILTSAFTIQWFDNPIESIHRIFESVPTCKRAFISFLSYGSFPEWKHYADLAGIPFTANYLPEEIATIEAFERLGYQCEAKTSWMNQVYPNALSFLNSIKHIGAGHNVSDQLLSPVQIRRLIRTWDLECEFGVEVRHKVVFLDIKKPS